QGPEIRTSDVERFYALYDSTGGKPSAAQLQAYLDGGTDGLLAFAKMRNTTGEQIAQAIEKQPQIYVNAKECAAVLPAVNRRLAKALGRLKEVYPEATPPPRGGWRGRGKAGSHCRQEWRHGRSRGALRRRPTEPQHRGSVRLCDRA